MRKYVFGQPPAQVVAGTWGTPCADPTGACGDNGAATAAQLVDPVGLNVDWEGTVYIADRRGHKIRKIGPNNTISTVFGTGEPGYNGSYDPFTFLPYKGTEAQLNSPQGLAVNTAGALFVADTGNGLIRTLSIQECVGLTAGLVNIDDSATIQGYNGDGQWANQTQLNGPRGIAVTARNQYVVTDTTNQRVRHFGPY